MKTPQETNPAGREETVVPWDLRDWVGAEWLAGCVEDLTASLDWSNPALQSVIRETPGYRPQALLNAVTWATATGTVDSRAIARLCAENPRLAAWCGPAAPSAEEVREFRRDNRTLLERTLLEVFKAAARKRFGCTVVPPIVRREMIGSIDLRLEYGPVDERQKMAA